jgi:hypothetical protein
MEEGDIRKHSTLPEETEIVGEGFQMFYSIPSVASARAL